MQTPTLWPSLPTTLEHSLLLSSEGEKLLLAFAESLLEAGENELTGNEYAKQLLHSALYRLCPRVPETDEDGNYIKGAKK